MWTSFALAVAISMAPAQAGQLALTNVRSTYGILGSPRPDNKFLPGDNFVLSFNIDGAKADADGKVLYSISMDVTDSTGKLLLHQPPRDLEAVNSLGGNSLPAFASLQIGLDAKPGAYTVKATVTDRSTKASQSVSGTYEILPLTFGLVSASITGDAEGRIPLAAIGEGQPLFISFSAVGFGRDASGKPNLSVNMRVLDETGKPTRAKPFLGELATETPANIRALPMQFTLDPNRAGKFSIELTATDKTSGKTTTLKLPLSIVKSK